MSKWVVTEDPTGFAWGYLRVSRVTCDKKGNYVISVSHKQSGRWIEIITSPAGKNFHIMTERMRRRVKL